MTGLETLREMMLERGASKSQANSKAVLIALECMTGMEDYRSLYDVKDDLEKAEAELACVRHEIAAYKNERDNLQLACKQKEKLLQTEIRKALEYIEWFNRSIESMETPEARDRMRAAQVFTNSVDIKTGYDNTAFIVCLQALLVGTQIDAEGALKKINPKLFAEMSLKTDWVRKVKRV